MSNNPAAILLGGGVVALAVARGLSHANIPVYALGHESDPIRWSRHRELFVDTGAGAASQERWLDWLERGPHEGVVLPCNDDALELIAGHRARLEGLGYVLTEADDAVVTALLDKERTYELARAAGVPTPRTITLRTAADLDAVGESIGFPCAVKPLHSHRFAEHFGLWKKVLLAADAKDLERTFTELERIGVASLATEIVPGADDQFVSFYGYLDERGETLLRFTKRKLRQNPPHFGLGCYHVTDWNPEVAEAGLRFLQKIGSRGLACVEFKRDARDGRLILIESNPRFTAASGLLRAAGVDLALFTYNRLLGRPLPAYDSSYRRGLHLWVPATDVRAAIGYRSSGELGLRTWARSLIGRQRFPVASLEDPGAVLGAIAYKFQRAAPRFISRARGGRPPDSRKG